MRSVCGGFLLLLGLLGGAGKLGSASLEPASPESVGLSPAGLERLSDFLESEVSAGRIPGAVALVARHGRIGFLRTYGVADIRTGRPMETNTLFRLASMTKALTSAAILMLQDEGALSVSDPVSKFLPGFGRPKVMVKREGEDERLEPAEREVTLRDLLTHTSGYSYGRSGPNGLQWIYRQAGAVDVFVPKEESTEEFVDRLDDLPLQFQPGRDWLYGLSTDILGRVVEVASGLTLDQFFRERLFRPLQMWNTGFFIPEPHRSRMASLYTPSQDGRLERVTDQQVTAEGWSFSEDFCFAGSRRFFSGGGGLVGPATDYVRFLQMILDDGVWEGRRLLSRQAVRSMTHDQLGGLQVPDWGHGDGFGYGFAVVTSDNRHRDVASVGTFSWGGLFHTYFWVDPQEGLIGLLMTQVFPFGHLQTRATFKQRVYEAIDDSGFYRTYWYEKGMDHANPFFNARQLRVNAPEATLNEAFAERSEVRSSGLARIEVPLDLRSVRRADLCVEVWGGHPGTAAKRTSMNGRLNLRFPEVGSEEEHCTHQYPLLNLPLHSLVRGHNSLQFACDQGRAFWGHYIVDNAGLRVGLPADHPSLQRHAGFAARVESSFDYDQDAVRLSLAGDPDAWKAVAEVWYQARFRGYDENGDGWESDWHGMTKSRRPYAMLGRATQPPFEVSWDTRLVAAQEQVSVRALITFQDDTNLLYQTPVTSGLRIPERDGVRVSLHKAVMLPAPFWSRDGRKQSCTIELPVEPSRIEAAELHVATWTGGAGTVTDYFTLNGKPFPVAEGEGHEVMYSKLPVDPALLRKGSNRIELRSDTTHHGIEVFKPGPALVIRVRP